MRGRSTGTTTAASTMGVYKLSIMDLEPKAKKSAPLPGKPSFIRGTATTIMGRRFSTKVQPTLRSFLETSDHPKEQNVTVPAADPLATSSSEDDSWSSSHFTASSTRTSNALTSDDDACLRELSLRSFRNDTGSSFAAMARHSTACCTDATVRQELRRKFHLEDDSAATTTAGRNSFANGRCSFRRELDTTEDRVESLALWEEAFELSTSARDRVVRKGDLHAAHSWPHGQSIRLSPSLGSGKLSLEGLFRKPKKATSSFFSGFLSSLSFSSSRRSRK